MKTGKKICNNVAASANKNKIFRRCIGHSCVVRFLNGRECLTIQSQRITDSLYFCFWNGSFGRSLGEIINSMFWKHLHHLLDVFIVNHSEDDTQLFACLLSKLLAEIFPSSHVVPCITDNERLFLYLLPPACQSC